MIANINEILTEWAYRTRDGLPNPKSMSHQIILEGILREYGWSIEARSELIGNLMEARSGTYVNNKTNRDKGIAGKSYGTKPTKPVGKDKDGAGDEDGIGKGKKKEEPKDDKKDEKEKDAGKKEPKVAKKEIIKKSKKASAKFMKGFSEPDTLNKKQRDASIKKSTDYINEGKTPEERTERMLEEKKKEE